MFELQKAAILTSPVSALFRTTISSVSFWESHSPEDHEFLKELEYNIRAQNANDSWKEKTLLDAVDALKRSYSFLKGKDFRDQDKLRGFYIWIFRISDDYLKLLKKADNDALCVFAFFCVLLRELERYWWMEGWAVHLMRRIYLMLDDVYRLWIRWPMEEIGWIPEPALR